MEEWRDLRGYEGIYQVSNLGRVKSLGRIVAWKNTTRMIKERILISHDNGKHHLKVRLSKNGEYEVKYVHELVATAFIPNPHAYTVVHHKNHNPQDNRAENLEWISKEEHDAIHANERAKRVDQIDKVTGEVLRQWSTPSDVERELGYSQRNISSCCRGERKSANNFIWKYPML